MMMSVMSVVSVVMVPERTAVSETSSEPEPAAVIGAVAAESGIARSKIEAGSVMGIPISVAAVIRAAVKSRIRAVVVIRLAVIEEIIS